MMQFRLKAFKENFFPLNFDSEPAAIGHTVFSLTVILSFPSFLSLSLPRTFEIKCKVFRRMQTSIKLWPCAPSYLPANIGKGDGWQCQPEMHCTKSSQSEKEQSKKLSSKQMHWQWSKMIMWLPKIALAWGGVAIHKLSKAACKHEHDKLNKLWN